MWPFATKPFPLKRPFFEILIGWSWTPGRIGQYSRAPRLLLRATTAGDVTTGAPDVSSIEGIDPVAPCAIGLWSWLASGIAEHPATTSDEMIRAKSGGNDKNLFIGAPPKNEVPEIISPDYLHINRSFARIFRVVDGIQEFGASDACPRTRLEKARGQAMLALLR